jgi:hypothetical protein
MAAAVAVLAVEHHQVLVLAVLAVAVQVEFHLIFPVLLQGQPQKVALLVQ